MANNSSRVTFTLCISFLVLGLACLPMVKPTSPQFVVLVLSLFLNVVILLCVIVKVRLEVRREKREQSLEGTSFLREHRTMMNQEPNE